MSPSDIIRIYRFYERGMFFYNDGKYPDACVNFKDALQINPNFLPARTHMALALAEQHKYVDAIKLLEEGRKNTPMLPHQQVEVLRLLGNICLIRQDYRAAVYYLKAARKIDPEDATLRSLLASCYCKSGQYAEGLDLMIDNLRKMK